MKLVSTVCVLAGLLLAASPAAAADPALDLERITVAELSAKMAAGQLTSVQATRAYINRIAATNARGPGLNAVRVTNPRALSDASLLDLERATGHVRGPLHGIPVHLITREALGTYLRHVKPDGIVAFHVSNRFLDLIPVVARLAKEHGAHAVLVRDDPDEDEDHKRSRSDWVLVSRDAAALEREAMVEREATEAEDRPEWRTWTDDYSNLIQILK